MSCPIDPGDWKKVEKFKTRRNVPHAVRALDYHHEEAKKSGSDSYNDKGFFSLLLLALVDAEYIFLWIDCGSSGSSSDTQIFNGSDLREKIKDGTLGLLQLQDLQRQDGGGECIWNIIEEIQGTTGHHGSKAKGCQRHCLCMCGVAQRDLRWDLPISPFQDNPIIPITFI